MIEVQTILEEDLCVFDFELSSLLNEGWEILVIQHTYDQSIATLKRFKAEADEDF